MQLLHLDIETYSSVDLKNCGMYKYVASEDFDILMVAYALGKTEPRCYSWNEIPKEFFDYLNDPEVLLIAHNAAFERTCFRAIGFDVPVERWRCTAVKAAYCGLPMALDAVSKALELGQYGKSSAGKALIRYFCMPVKATNTNGGRTRNLPSDNLAKWQEFKEYCRQDVVAEQRVAELTKAYQVPASEWRAYQLDQKINDRGVRIDIELAETAIYMDTRVGNAMQKRLKEITGLDNPNSTVQLCRWLSERLNMTVKTIAKNAIEEMLGECTDQAVREVLLLRQRSSKTSIKKYKAMLNCEGIDGRARGLFQFYGAGRTGRWAGRLIQLQNLPRNSMKPKTLAVARETLLIGDSDMFSLLYDETDALSQLIRTAMVPSSGKRFAVADFSAIEARVLAWLAGEQWRLDAFNAGKDIYVQSAARMFSVPPESIIFKDAAGKKQKGPNGEMRSKGKVAELALGYQGAVNAMITMGAEREGLSEAEMLRIVKLWRSDNPKIKQFWDDMDNCSKQAVKYHKTIKHPATGIVFSCNPESMQITLPSGRQLIYWNAEIYQKKVEKNGNVYHFDAVRYRGTDGVTKQWTWIPTYGGKIVENIVQAIARDLLLYSMHTLDQNGYDLVMHIHDETVSEVDPEQDLDEIFRLMAIAPEWAKGLPLAAEGFMCDFYQKD